MNIGIWNLNRVQHYQLIMGLKMSLMIWMLLPSKDCQTHWPIPSFKQKWWHLGLRVVHGDRRNTQNWVGSVVQGPRSGMKSRRCHHTRFPLNFPSMTLFPAQSCTGKRHSWCLVGLRAFSQHDAPCLGLHGTGGFEKTYWHCVAWHISCWERLEPGREHLLFRKVIRGNLSNGLLPKAPSADFRGILPPPLHAWCMWPVPRLVGIASNFLTSIWVTVFYHFCLHSGQHGRVPGLLR